MSKAIPVTFEGVEFKSLRELATKECIPYNKLTKLIRKGETVDDAMYQLKSLVAYDDNEVISNNEIEDYTFDNFSPITYTINNPNQVISEIQKNNKIKYINLIDFENLVENEELILSYTRKKDSLNIFFYNACIYSNEFFKLIKNSDNINLQVLTYSVKNQLVDHLITYYLGAITTKYPNLSCNILSRDHEFYEFIESLNNSKVKGIGLNYISDKNERFKYSLCKYIANIKLLSHRNCIKNNEFEKLFKGFVKKANKREIDRLINQLIEFKFMTKSVKGNLIIYKFDMGYINKIVEEYSI